MNVLQIGPDDPAWDALDDDDWSGHAFSNWLTTISKYDVVIVPPKDCLPELVERMRVVIARNAKSVRIA